MNWQNALVHSDFPELFVQESVCSGVCERIGRGFARQFVQDGFLRLFWNEVAAAWSSGSFGQGVLHKQLRKPAANEDSGFTAMSASRYPRTMLQDRPPTEIQLVLQGRAHQTPTTPAGKRKPVGRNDQTTQKSPAPKQTTGQSCCRFLSQPLETDCHTIAGQSHCQFSNKPKENSTTDPPLNTPAATSQTTRWKSPLLYHEQTTAQEIYDRRKNP